VYSGYGYGHVFTRVRPFTITDIFLGGLPFSEGMIKYFWNEHLHLLPVNTWILNAL
jgi:hypothetical protein